MARKKKEDKIEELKEKIEDTAEKVEKEIEDKIEVLKETTKNIAETLTDGDKERKESKQEWEEDVDIGIDVFSQQIGEHHESKEEKRDEKIKETKITKRELEEKAKKLAEKFGGKEESLKEKLEEEREKSKEKGKTLIPLEDYIKYGTYIGTKVITPHLRPYVYRRRNDGIAIINTYLIDKKLKEMIEFLVKYNPEDWILVCKREAGWKAIEKFSQLTGVRIFTKKYPAGILTNSRLPSFFETELVFICDPWLDKNALHDAKKIKKKIFSLCDTNNYTFDIDFFVPVNNKSGKSIGLIFYILAREYLKARGKKVDFEIEDFVSEDEA